MRLLLRSLRRPATKRSTRPSRTRGVAEQWATEKSFASIQAGNVCETAMEAARLSNARVEDIFAE
jgi:hypothetical protein